MVRQRFLSQNGRGSYVDFDNFANRQGQDQDQNRGQGRGQEQNQFRNPGRGQESIQDHGSARSSNESRDLTYSCVVDTQRSEVASADYQLSGGGLRSNGRTWLK
jgi:hypothetical protein